MANPATSYGHVGDQSARELDPPSTTTTTTVALATIANQNNVAAVGSIHARQNPAIGQISPDVLNTTRPPKEWTPEEKEAYSRYLLHFQRYNASYSKKERELLGYKPPLYAAKVRQGYVRTDSRLFKLAKPWIRKRVWKHIKRIFRNLNEQFPIGMKLCTQSAPEIIRYFWGAADGDLEIIELTLDELEICQADISKASAGTKFLFSLRVCEQIDCRLLWGACSGEKGLLDFVPLRELSNHYEGKIISILNKTGAVPDRMAVNAFLTYGGTPLTTMGIKRKDAELKNIEPIDQAHWNDTLEQIRKYDLQLEPGVEIYRDAILYWVDQFFLQHPALHKLAMPLLVQHVEGWLSEDPNIVRWSKAYQNLCEIVMFCIDAHPERFEELDISAAMLHQLQLGEEFSGICQNAGLFAYASSSLFYVLDCLLIGLTNRESHSRWRGTPRVACVVQNYFETLDVIQVVENRNSIVVGDRVKQLDEIEGCPDIVICDIHPNNAAKRRLFKNNLKDWVPHILGENPNHHMVLILDLTLNHLRDREVHELLEILHPHISSGQLEFFGIQSLAKLIQMGADNFSGGSCIYLGHQDVKFPTPPPSKSAFYTLSLTDEFSSIIDRYFTLVRTNTDWMYRTLTKRLEEIRETIWVDDSQLIIGCAHKSPRKHPFCVAEVTQSGDETTVYVALNFQPLLTVFQAYSSCFDIYKGYGILETEEIKSTKWVEEKFIGKIYRCMLDFARERKLPITGRQSFGFSLSNMSTAVTAIRFSVGVENQQYLEEYVDLVADFSYLLSLYLVKRRANFEWQEFKDFTKKTHAILLDQEAFPPTTLSLIEEFPDGEREGLQEVQLSYCNQRLTVEFPDNIVNEKQCARTISEDNLAFACGQFNKLECNRSRVMALLFHLICLKGEATLVQDGYWKDNNFTLEGIFEDLSSPFSNSHQQVAEDTTIQFSPEFSLSHEQVTYTASQVYIDPVRLELKDAGSSLTRLGRLNWKETEQVYEKCVRNIWAVKIRDDHDLELIFGERKDFLNYLQEILRHYRQSRPDISGVVKFVNSLLEEELPLPHDNTWESQTTPLDRLCEILQSLGTHLVYQLSSEVLASLNQLSEIRCRRAIFQGMVDGLFRDYRNRDIALSSNQATHIAQLFSKSEFEEIIEKRRYKYENPLSEICAFVKRNPEQAERVGLFIRALFPVIRAESMCHQLFPVYDAASLKELAYSLQAVDQPQLLNHLIDIERELIENIQNISAKKITRYLGLFVVYPMEKATQVGLCKMIGELPEKTRSEWLLRPNFFFLPIPSDAETVSEIGYDPWAITFLNESHQDRLCLFFQVIEGQRLMDNLLVSKLEERDLISSLLRWVMMTQNEDLAHQLITYCESEERKQIFIEAFGDLTLGRAIDELPLPQSMLAKIETIMRKEGSKMACYTT